MVRRYQPKPWLIIGAAVAAVILFAGFILFAILLPRARDIQSRTDPSLWPTDLPLYEDSLSLGMTEADADATLGPLAVWTGEGPYPCVRQPNTSCQWKFYKFDARGHFVAASFLDDQLEYAEETEPHDDDPSYRRRVRPLPSTGFPSRWQEPDPTVPGPARK